MTKYLESKKEFGERRPAAQMVRALHGKLASLHSSVTLLVLESLVGDWEEQPTSFPAE